VNCLQTCFLWWYCCNCHFDSHVSCSSNTNSRFLAVACFRSTTKFCKYSTVLTSSWRGGLSSSHSMNKWRRSSWSRASPLQCLKGTENQQLLYTVLVVHFCAGNHILVWHASLGPVPSGRLRRAISTLPHITSTFSLSTLLGLLPIWFTIRDMLRHCQKW